MESKVTTAELGSAMNYIDTHPQYSVKKAKNANRIEGYDHEVFYIGENNVSTPFGVYTDEGLVAFANTLKSVDESKKIKKLADGDEIEGDGFGNLEGEVGHKVEESSNAKQQTDIVILTGEEGEEGESKGGAPSGKAGQGEGGDDGKEEGSKEGEGDEKSKGDQGDEKTGGEKEGEQGEEEKSDEKGGGDEKESEGSGEGKGDLDKEQKQEEPPPQEYKSTKFFNNVCGSRHDNPESILARYIRGEWGTIDIFILYVLNKTTAEGLNKLYGYLQNPKMIKEAGLTVDDVVKLDVTLFANLYLHFKKNKPYLDMFDPNGKVDNRKDNSRIVLNEFLESIYRSESEMLDISLPFTISGNTRYRVILHRIEDQVWIIWEDNTIVSEDEIKSKIRFIQPLPFDYPNGVHTGLDFSYSFNDNLNSTMVEKVKTFNIFALLRLFVFAKNYGGANINLFNDNTKAKILDKIGSYINNDFFKFYKNV